MWADLRDLAAPGQLPRPEHEPAEAREAADEILSRPEYRWEERSSNPLESVADWIADRLSDIFPDVGFGGGGGSLPTWVGYVVLALLVVLAAVIVWRARRGLRPDRRPRRAGATVVVDRADETLDWAAEAARHEAAGRWRDGLRCRYRALVGELAARGVIPDLVGRTAGEFVRDVRRSAPAAAPAFREATDVFEAAWYGGEAGGEPERDRFARLAGDVLAAAAPTGPDGPGGAGAERELVAPS